MVYILLHGLVALETGFQSQVELCQRLKKWYLILPCRTLSIVLFTNPSARARYDTRSVFKRSFTGLTSCLTKAEEPCLSYYLSIAGGRIIGFIPFPRVLLLCEMQLFLSRIWTRVAVSISYDDNHYTTGTTTYSQHYKLRLKGKVEQPRDESSALPYTSV